MALMSKLAFILPPAIEIDLTALSGQPAVCASILMQGEVAANDATASCTKIVPGTCVRFMRLGADGETAYRSVLPDIRIDVACAAAGRARRATRAMRKTRTESTEQRFPGQVAPSLGNPTPLIGFPS